MSLYLHIKIYKLQIEKRATTTCQQCLYLFDRIMGDFYFLFTYVDPLNFVLSMHCNTKTKAFSKAINS